jgi:hypothetical protein
VLCLGPFYHLQPPADRDRAAHELYTSTGVAESLAGMASSRPDLYTTALDLIESTAADPSILGLGNHLATSDGRRLAGGRQTSYRERPSGLEGAERPRALSLR